MQSKHRDNFYRMCSLTQSNGTKAYRNLLGHHLLTLKVSLPDFINIHQHDLLHLCYSYACCLCTSGHIPQKPRVLRLAQLDILFDKHGQRQPNHNSKTQLKNEFCCCMSKPSLTVNDLDLTLIRCLLVNFCDDLFWECCLGVKNITLEDFLNNYKHEVFHSWNQSPCSLCLHLSKGSIRTATMTKRNWNELYIPNSTLCNPSNLPDPLYFKAKPGICVKDLHIDGLSWKLQKQLCPLRIAVDELVELRNTMYGHGVVDEIDDMKFHDAWIRMERCILVLSSPCKRCDAAKQELEELKIRSLDQSLCIQYHTSLLQEFKMSLQIEEKLDVIAERMDQFEKLHSFEDGRRSIILRWDGNNAKCRIPKFIEIGHATGAFIPSESYGGHAMQTGVPSSGNVFNKMMNYVSSAVSCKTYGNQEYEVEDNEVLGTPHSTLRAKNIDNKMTPQVHFKSEEDNDDITSGDEDSSEENDLHICGWCKCEFAGLSEFFRHKLRCSRNNKTEEVCCSGGTLAATGGDEYNAEIVFENVNYEWSEKAVKKKFKLQKHNHLGFRLTHKEKGSLILWTKLSGRILKDEDTFTTCFEQFVTQILRQCPLVMDKYVGIRITITIVEWLADYHNNDNDLMRCGRCYNEFHYLNAFSDHKGLKCLKRTAEQIAEIGDLDIDSRVLEVTDRIDIDAKIQTETNTRLVIAGIDFGTTYSGYAHCLRTDYRANKKKQELKFPHWKRGDGRASYKAPNCILFKPDMSFHSFGYDAVNNCLRFINNEEVDEWFYFDNFKMVLYNEKEALSKDTLLYETLTSSDGNRKKMKAIDVFAAVIHFFKDHLLESVKMLDINEGSIDWVLTVPAIWSLKSKQFMRDAAEQAGIASNQLTLALEPEVAAMYYIRNSDVAQETEELVLYDGDKYIVLDQGGGTTDISVHEVVGNNCVKEIYQSCGGNWGGTAVSEEIFKFISTYFGQNVIKCFKENSATEYFELIHNIELVKKQFHSSSKDKKQSHSSPKVTIRLPASLLHAYEHEKSISTVTYAAHAKYQRVELLRDKLRIPYEIVCSFYEPSIKRVTNELNCLLSKEEFSDVKIVLAVGGFSQSTVMKNAITENVRPYVKVVVPEDPEVAVLKGAVLYGFQPEMVTARIAKFTYGVAVKKVSFKDKGVHYHRMFVNAKSDEFDIHLKKGQMLNVGEFLDEHVYFCEVNEHKVCFQFFSTDDINPHYTSSQNCTMIGILCVDIEPTESNEVLLSVKINASETDFRASVTNDQTGRECKSAFNFYV